MTVEAIMEEYDLTIDDLRYYLSFELAESLLTYREDPHGLARLIWSGKLESELYNMADRYIEEKKEELSRDLIDEARLRETFREALRVRKERRS
jgi:hypothetical protein